MVNKHTLSRKTTDFCFLSKLIIFHLIYELLKDSYVSDKTKISLITSFDEVLSLNLISNEEENLENDAYIKEKIAERNEAKKNKNYVLADEIRDNLLKEGIKLIDTREGTIYEIIKD